MIRKKKYHRPSLPWSIANSRMCVRKTNTKTDKIRPFISVRSWMDKLCLSIDSFSSSLELIDSLFKGCFETIDNNAKRKSVQRTISNSKVNNPSFSYRWHLIATEICWHFVMHTWCVKKVGSWVYDWEKQTEICTMPTCKEKVIWIEFMLIWLCCASKIIQAK